MKTRIDQFSATSPNPALTVEKNGTVLYSNKVGESLLNEWGVGIGEKLPSYIGDFVQRVIFQNSPEKMEVKVGKRLYLTVFHPLFEEKCVCISGFDISDQKEFEEKVQESKAQEMANLELAEIVDGKAIQFLMGDFYKLAHIPIGLNDLKGNVLVSVGWQDICTRFHRVHPEAGKHCIESKAQLSAGIPSGEYKLFKCKNNMWDVATPIIVNGQHVGNVFSGQFFFDDEPLDYELFRSQAKKYGFNEKEYIASLEKVPRLSRKAVDTSMAFLMTFANMLSQLSYSNIKLAQSLAERDALVDALRESEKREKALSEELTVILDSVPAAVLITHDPGALKLTGNRTSYEWLQLPESANLSKAAPEGERPETYKLFKNGMEISLADMPVRISASGKEVHNYEFDIVYSDGTMRHLLGGSRPLLDEQGNPRGAVAAFIDITERKHAEQEREIAVAFLSIVNESKGTADLVRSAVSFFRERSGFEAVGIRLKDGDDYTYFETNGFPEEFVRMENSLCAWDEAGQPIRDTAGCPIHECMCGNVICGRFDPSKPFFTARGSFWTNSTTELLTTTTDADRQANTRNRCNSEGYESVALIALCLGKERLGLLQLNERRKGQFSPEMIAMWERLADYLAVALAKARADEELHEAYGNLQEQSVELEVQTQELQMQSEKLQKSNEALQESKERFRLVLENSLDAAYRRNLQTDIYDYMSPVIEQITGFSAQEMSAMNINEALDHMHPDDRPLVASEMARALDAGTGNFEYRFKCKDEKYRWLADYFKVIKDQSGSPLIIGGVVRDITERKQTEQALRKSEEKYRNIVETANEGIIIVDAEARTTYVNEKIAEMLKYNRRDLIGRSIYDFIDVESKVIPKLNLEKRKQGINQVYELGLICKDGSSLWALVNAKGSFNNDGKFTGSLAMLTDITERKRAEKSLQESEIRFRALAENSPDIVTRFDRQHRHIYANPAAVESYDISLEKIIGKTQVELGRDPKKAKFWDEHLENTFFKEKTETLEYEYISLQDKKYYFNTIIVPEFADGKIISVLAISRDITDIKEAEAKLKETLDNLENLVEERTSELNIAYNSLKENEKGLAEAQRMAHIGNWEWDIATDKANWSDEMYRIFGCSPQCLTPSYEEFLNYIHYEDRDYVRNAAKIGKKEKPFSIDFKIVLADGEERTVHMQSEVLFNEKNSPVKMRGTVQDITERKKYEEKIRNLANIVESSNDAIITKSLEGTITSWNKGAEQVYGYSAEEVLGKPISILTPSHSDKEPKKFTEMIKQGEKIHHYETSRLRKDEKLIDVSLNLSPIFDASGRLTAVSIIARDITERKRVEEKLRESEEKYRNIVETANEGILIINNEALITYANKKLADMLGYTLQESIGRPVWDFLTEEAKAIVKLNLKNRCLGIDDSYELKFIRKDGSLLWMFINAKPLFDKDSEFVGSMSMLTDITRRKEVEQTLANFEIAREKEIHHRIKNNLQVVSSLLDLQAYKFEGRNDVKDSEIIDAFRESQNRVKSMALIHERLYRGNESETLNFSAYVDELADNLLSTYKLGNIDISLNKNLEKDFFLDMDTAIPLGIIINEIISNSFKHAFLGRDKGEIRIKLHKEEKVDFINIREESKCEDCKSTNFVLSVSDNGVGIPENLDIENLDSLGLHLVTSLVEQLDGELEIKKNNGTEFTLRFIVTEKHNKASTPVPNNYSESPHFLH
jgi:PAS domain S-box-containing protein